MSNVVLEIDVNLIQSSSLNPRKTFDQEALAELAESIKASGLLQPILLRSLKDRYEIVCGERRYRASIIAGMTHISAICREMSEDDALTAMITENLQRRDVNPLEEAVAYKILNTRLKKTHQQIAAELGVKPSYVFRRLKLNDLIPGLQEKLLEGVFKLGDAEKMAAMPVKLQNQVLKDSPYGYLNHYIDNKINEIDPSIFDPENENLVTKAGKCSSCIFNINNQNLLFPELKGNLCSNPDCFRNKKEAAIDLFIENIDQTHPGTVRGFSHWNKNNSEVKKVIESGLKVISIDSSYKELTPEEIPEVPNRNDYDDEEEYSEALSDYEKELKKFHEELAFIAELKKAGKTIQVLRIDKHYRGELKIYQIPDDKDIETDQSEFQKEEIEAEIKSIKRNTDKNIFEKVKTALKESEYYSNQDPINDAEKLALHLILFQSLSYSYLEQIRKQFEPENGIRIDNEYSKILLFFVKHDSEKLRNMILRTYLQFKIDVDSTYNEYAPHCLYQIMCATPEYKEKHSLIKKEITSKSDAKIKALKAKLPK